MPEGKQEKKKTWIAKRILKWIGLGLLILLLIAAFIFQAPWKVITLLAVILLACTALPKPHRKFFWASVGVVVIALIIWVFLPDRNGDWRPYTFDDELAALEAARAIPDEQNAAVIYNQLLEDYNEAAFEPNFLDPNLDDLTRKEPWSSQDYPELAEWLKGHQNTIATLLEVSKKEKCRFPIAAEAFEFNKLGDHLSPMRRWAFLLVRAANNDLGEGRIDAGLEKYIATLKIADHICQQPTLIEILVGIAIEALATKQLNRFVIKDNPIEAHLTLIENNLTRIKHDWSTDLPKILECEKLMMKNMISMFYEVNPNGKVRLSRDPLAIGRTDFPELPTLNFWRRKGIKASTRLWWFFFPSTPLKAGEIIDDSYEKLYAIAKPDYNWHKEPEEPKEFSLISAKINFRFMTEMLVSIIEPAYHTIHDLYLRLTADKRGSQILIALRRYKNTTGHWPETLDDIKSFAPSEIFVDPINKSNFVYKLTEENFSLYSKGKNNIDEDGQYNSKWDPNSSEEKIEKDDWLIWPPKSCKTKEENDNAD